MLTFGSPQVWGVLIAFFLENFLGSPDSFVCWILLVCILDILNVMLRLGPVKILKGFAVLILVGLMQVHLGEESCTSYT